MIGIAGQARYHWIVIFFLVIFLFVYMDKRASPVGAISLQSGEISVGGMKIFPCKHISRAGPLIGMKNVEMRVRRRNYVIEFSNFQVNRSIKVKFHP